MELQTEHLPPRQVLEPLQYTVVFHDVRLDRDVDPAQGVGQRFVIDRVCQHQSQDVAERMFQKVSPALTEEARGQLRGALTQLGMAVEGLNDGKVLFEIGVLLWSHGAGLMLAAGKPGVNRLKMTVDLTRADTPNKA